MASPGAWPLRGTDLTLIRDAPVSRTPYFTWDSAWDEVVCGAIVGQACDVSPFVMTIGSDRLSLPTLLAALKITKGIRLTQSNGSFAFC